VFGKHGGFFKFPVTVRVLEPHDAMRFLFEQTQAKAVGVRKVL